MKVLVIGSGGYMGRHLVERLGIRGADIVALSSSDGSGIDPVSGLLPEDMAFPSGTDSVVYMAQSPRYRQVPEGAAHVLLVNAVSAVRAAVSARRAGIRRFVYVSTGTVYAPSFSPISEDAAVRRDNWYVLSKLHAEEALALFRNDMEVIITRPFGVYGPAQQGRLVPNLLHSVSSGIKVSLQPHPFDPHDDGGLRISLCYVDDASDILVRLVEAGGPPCLNLAGPEAISIRDLAVAIGKLVGRPPEFEVSTAYRDTDLVADTTLLNGTVRATYTPFSAGLARVVSAAASV